MNNWKKARAEHRKQVRDHKKESWRKMAETINKDTPLSKVWECIRKIKGRTPRKTTILLDNGQYFSSSSEICNKLAVTFSNISKISNYSSEFQNIKMQAEISSPNFASPNTEPYNQPFNLHELQYALSRTKNTTAGPDNVNYNMIKHLPENGHIFLLAVMNKIFHEGFFPEQWWESTIIPIPKPNKNHTDATNYRPIALTSVICKTMERIINETVLLSGNGEWIWQVASGWKKEKINHRSFGEAENCHTQSLC